MAPSDPAPVEDVVHPVVLALRIAVCAVAGYVAGVVVGLLSLRIVLWVSGDTTGWEGLAAVATALVAFGPVGAITGGLAGVGAPLRRWWRRRSTGARAGAVWGAVLAVAAAVGYAIWADETAVGATGLAVLGIPAGALAGLVLGSLAARPPHRDRTAG